MIETARLVLRPPAPDDLAWIAAAMNTEAVLRHLGGETLSPAELADGLERDIAGFAAGTYRKWTVWRRGDDKDAGPVRVGRCGLFQVRASAAPAGLHGQDEIGWTFAEQHWGHGYASEAARAVLDFAFTELDLPVLHAQTSDSNAPSTRMMQRLGFARSAELDYVDPDYPAADNPTTVYRLTREQWARGA